MPKQWISKQSCSARAWGTTSLHGMSRENRERAVTNPGKTRLNIEKNIMATLKCPANHKSDSQQLQATASLAYITGSFSRHSQAHCTCRSIPACFAPGVPLSGVVFHMSALAWSQSVVVRLTKAEVEIQKTVLYTETAGWSLIDMKQNGREKGMRQSRVNAYWSVLNTTVCCCQHSWYL